MRTCFQEWFEPKNLSDYPYFAVENAPLKLNIGFQMRTGGSTAEEWQNGRFYRGVCSRTGGSTAEYVAFGARSA